MKNEDETTPPEDSSENSSLKKSGKDSVSGQLDSMLKSNSPLMKQAETYGKQQSNKRGLINSSMGTGAAQSSMIKNAMPAASQDAAALQDLNKLQASSTANAWGVMANNVTDIVAQGMEGIANINANPDISQSNKKKMIDQIIDMRDTDIEFQEGLYGSFSDNLANTGLFPNL